MLLNDELIEIMVEGNGEESLSGIQFFCDDAIKEPAAESFSMTFNAKWKRAVSKAAEKFEGVDSVEEGNYNPAVISQNDQGFFVSLDVMYISISYGDYCDNELGNEALEEALDLFKKQYPNVSFYGCVQYFFSDLHGGEVRKYSVYSDNKYKEIAYEFVGKALENMGDEEDPIWEGLNDYLSDEDDYKEILENMHGYRKWIKDYDHAIELLLKLAEKNEGADLKRELMARVQKWDD